MKFFFFPFSKFKVIIILNKDFLVLLMKYYQLYSFRNSKHVLNMIAKESPKQLILLNKEIFLPIYSVTASGLTYMTIDSEENSYNNLFKACDSLFSIGKSNRTFFVIGGIYYL